VKTEGTIRTDAGIYFQWRQMAIGNTLFLEGDKTRSHDSRVSKSV